MREIDTEKLQNDAEAQKTFNDSVVQEFRSNGGLIRSRPAQRNSPELLGRYRNANTCSASLLA
jgi:hypothetical protein